MDVQLRPVRLTDWPAVHTWGQLEQVCRYQPWGPNSEGETRVFVEGAVNAQLESPQSRFPRIVEVDGVVVGLGELNVRSVANQQAEIGYSLHPDWWGRGVGTQLARQLIRFGFERLDLHRIYATCDPRNLASARVLAKAGMTYEGRLRHTAHIRDGWRDSEMFSILRDEWPG
jgi:ribosomal-protein-alanine N-acetyltransferase